MLRFLIFAIVLSIVAAVAPASAQTGFEDAMARGEAAFSEGRYRVSRSAFQEAVDLAGDTTARARAATGVARAWWRSDPPTWRGDMNGSRNRVRPNREAPRLLLDVIAMIEAAAAAQLTVPGVGEEEAIYAEAIAWFNLMHAEARTLGWPDLLRSSEHPEFVSLEPAHTPTCDNIVVYEPMPDFPDAEANDWRSGAVVVLLQSTADNRLARLDVAASAGPEAFAAAVASVMTKWTMRPVEAGETCSREGVQFLQITFARRNGAPLGLAFGSDWFAPRGSNR